jgi:Asp/Glu/hydantoin racemase
VLGLPLALLATIAVATLRKPLNVGLSEASVLDAASISETVGIVYSARRRRQ